MPEKCQHECMKRLRFLAMQKSSVAPDAQSYSTAIRACGVVDMWPAALELMSQLGTERLSADVITYNSALNSCAAAWVKNRNRKRNTKIWCWRLKRSSGCNPPQK